MSLQDDYDKAVHKSTPAYSLELEAEIARLRGALADIAFSTDMTLSVAREKARRIYEGTADKE